MFTLHVHIHVITHQVILTIPTFIFIVSTYHIFSSNIRAPFLCKRRETTPPNNDPYKRDYMNFIVVI